MWRFLFKVIKKSVKKLKPSNLKAKLNVFKIPKKAGVRMNAKRAALSKSKKVKRTLNRVRRMTSPKQRLKDEIHQKVSILENLVTMENEMLAKRSNAEREIGEAPKEILRNNKLLNAYSHAELKEINGMIDKELKDVGIKSAEDIQRVIDDEQYRSDILQSNAYDTFMENWKEGFFSMDSESVEGMSDEEKEVVWNQILENKNIQSSWWIKKIAK